MGTYYTAGYVTSQGIRNVLLKFWSEYTGDGLNLYVYSRNNLVIDIVIQK